MNRNALAAHLRRATHSRSIVPAMDHRVKRPVTKDLGVPQGKMLPGLGAINTRGAESLHRTLGQRLGSPRPQPIMRSQALSLGIPLDRRVSTPVTHSLSLPRGPFMPGFGSNDFMPGMGEDDEAEADFMPGMGDLGAHAAASPHRKPKLRKVQKPRIKGAPATSHPTTSASFMPGMGEEEDCDIVAFGTLSAAELADDEIPANTAPQAISAATSGLKTMALFVGGALLLGAFLKSR